MQRDFLRIFLRPWSETGKISRFDGAHEQLPSANNTSRCTGWNEFRSLLMFAVKQMSLLIKERYVIRKRDLVVCLLREMIDLLKKVPFALSRRRSRSSGRSKGLFMPVHGALAVSFMKRKWTTYALRCHAPSTGQLRFGIYYHDLQTTKRCQSGWHCLALRMFESATNQSTKWSEANEKKKKMPTGTNHDMTRHATAAAVVQSTVIIVNNCSYVLVQRT